MLTVGSRLVALALVFIFIRTLISVSLYDVLNVQPLTSSCPLSVNRISLSFLIAHLPDHTFCETLAIKYPKYRHALWKPSPKGLYDAVEVGNIGFIHNSCFHHLFNILLSGDCLSYQNFGVLESYQPLCLKAQTLSMRMWRAHRISALGTLSQAYLVDTTNLP